MVKNTGDFYYDIKHDDTGFYNKSRLIFNPPDKVLG